MIRDLGRFVSKRYTLYHTARTAGDWTTVESLLFPKEKIQYLIKRPFGDRKYPSSDSAWFTVRGNPSNKNPFKQSGWIQSGWVMTSSTNSSGANRPEFTYS
jgi:hypothetical protein